MRLTSHAPWPTLLAMIISLFTAADAAAEKRVALLIGNSNYLYVGQLPNPANDVASMAAAFKNANFDLVDSRLDLSATEMRRALREFADKTSDADIAIVYYAGHGIEVDGTNYLIPIDAHLERDSDVYDEAFPLDRILFAVESARQLRLVILDACRDNLFSKRMKRTASRSIGRGLARVEPSTPNTVVAFAAKAGSIDSDGDKQNSPFTIALVEHLTTPGLDLRRAFGFIRDKVLKATNNKQEPFMYGSLGGNDVVLVPAVQTVPPASPAMDPNAGIRRDYELAAQVGTREAWDYFLSTYKEGLYANLARAQRNKLVAEEAAGERARLATGEQARLIADAEKSREQAKAAAQLIAAEEEKAAAAKVKQAEQTKATASPQARPPEPTAKLASLTATQGAHPKDKIIIEKLNFDTNPAAGIKTVKIAATLYLPLTAAPVPAMVIANSSGGVVDWMENYYAQALAKNGIAALVVDSFKSRGVREVLSDQSAVTSWQMENDAFAALAELHKDKRIDPARIGIMGVGKGGLVAQNAAFTVRREVRRTGMAAFAVHVPIVPDCVAQFRNVETTGKPIFFMLAEFSDFGKPCIQFAERIRAAGNPSVTTKTYAGAYEGWEYIGPVSFSKNAENYSRCFALIEDNGDRTMTATSQRVPGQQVAEWMKKNCVFRGYKSGGGTEKLKRQATDDIIAFLRTNGF